MSEVAIYKGPYLGDHKHYVRLDAYNELKAERDALAAEVESIREQSEDVYSAGYNHGNLNTVDGIAYAPGVKDEFYHNALQVMLEAETPATNAYLNSVRAEGVEMLLASLPPHYTARADIEQFANQLRAGEPS